MRDRLQLLLIASIGVAAVHCAKGSEFSGEGGFGGAGGEGGEITGGDSSSNSTGSPSSSSSQSGPSSSQSSGPGSTSGTSSSSQSSSVTTSQSSNVSSSSGGPVDCDPVNPGPGCGAGMHCVPEPDATPVCEGPVGAGTQYVLCADRTDCAATLECINDGVDNCCMSWCSNDGDCLAGETCTFLSTPLFVGNVEYGACWDGYPCVI